MMNHERMLKIADVIEENPDHFNMAYFAALQSLKDDEGWFDGRIGPHDTRLLIGANLHECGTTACIAGWAVWLWAADVNPQRTIDDEAAELLDLDMDTADELFNNWDLHSAEIAADHLREMVA